MTMPNFLVIGAAKAGTTALYSQLTQHPDIYMSAQKELKFFPFENQRPNFLGPGDREEMQQCVTNIEDYRACFSPGANHPARGEASVLYLYYPRASERICHHIPNAKLIAILRHPAERAYSHYLMLKRDGLEELSFSEALAAEDQRVSDNWSHRWHLRRRGYYAAQLERYFDLFQREQIKIYLYEDYLTDPIGCVQDIFRFLSVDDTFVPDTSARHNEAKFPRNLALHGFLTESRSAKNVLKPLVPKQVRKHIKDRLTQRNLVKPQLPAEQRRQLIEIFRQDIVKLQEMIQRDLSHWLQ